MRFSKPSWLIHSGEKKDHEVYSCHVSPDGQRLATAAGDGHVRIWSTKAILASAGGTKNGTENNGPRQLASLAYHSGTVHSVRFSPNGKYLASGADDKIVCIYTLDSSAPAAHSSFGSGEAPPVENWRIFRRLIGHDNDVQDLGWSCDSSILVSVGLDSKVVVWSGSTFEKLKTLSQHQSHVKGITFDPANKYFATASDDRSIKIYRFTSPPANATAYDQTSNFTLETTITAPFATSPLTTYFRRCSWSPEGAHIAAANAVNGPVGSIAIVSRGSWDSEINLIGHEGPVEVCAFSPRLFTRAPPATLNGTDGSHQQPSAVTVVACAGQDRTLSVWNTSFPRPFATTMELCAKSITDLAWTPDGETLFLTSLDGTIAALLFEKGELGYSVAGSENDRALAKYGAGRRAGIVENTDALRLEEGSKAGELKGVEGRMGELMGEAVTQANGHTKDSPTDVAAAISATNGVKEDAVVGATPVATAAPVAPKDPQQEKVDKLKQRVTITKDGKKRIAPLLVSSSNQGERNLPKPQLQASIKASGGGLVDDQPSKILDLSKPYDGLPKGGLASLLIGNKRKYAGVEGEEDDSQRKRNEKRVHFVQKQGATPIVNNTAEGLVPTSSSKTAATAADNAAALEVLRPAIVNPSLTVSQVRLAIPMVRAVITRPLDLSKSASDDRPTDADDADVTATLSSNSTSSVVFEARNATGPSRTGRAADREPTRITVSRRSQTLWQDFLPRGVLLVTGNRHFWAAACEDGSLHLWTPAGRRLLNAIVLEAQPVILDCRGRFLLVLTAIGQAHVFSLASFDSPSALHPPVSLAPILDAASTMQARDHLTASPSVIFARLNSAGTIIVALSNGDGFAYNAKMYVWQRLSEAWWAVGSQYWNTAPESSSNTSTTSTSQPSNTNRSHTGDPSLAPENLSSSILPLLERHTTSTALLRGRSFFLQRLVRSLLSAEGFETFESSVSIAHLENRLAALKLLGAGAEFRVVLLMYARRIGAEGLRGKVEELLQGLLVGEGGDDETRPGGGGGGDDEDEAMDGMQDGVGDASTARSTDPAKEEERERDLLLGHSRLALLKEVLLALGKYRDLQRLTVGYARVAGVLDQLK